VAPERYLDAHDDAEADALRAQVGPKAPYQGNTNDVIALVAAVVGVVAFSVNFGGMYVLPLFGLVLGIVAVLQARQSLNRKRTPQSKAYADVGLGRDRELACGHRHLGRVHPRMSGPDLPAALHRVAHPKRPVSEGAST